MRWIGTLDNEPYALIFSLFLDQKNIKHQIEIEKKTDWGSPDYGLSQCQVWIYDEDQVNAATQWFQQFKANPKDPIFNQTTILPSAWSPAHTLAPSVAASQPPPPASPRHTAWENQPLGPITRFLLVICSILFILTQVTTPKAKVPDLFSGWDAFGSPVEQALLYDFPHFYDLIEELIAAYPTDTSLTMQQFEAQNQPLLKQLEKTPVWQGFYSLLSKKGVAGTQEALQHTPMFEKIRQGEVWRLITPVFMHGDIFHIFFNMLWLLVLGKQMEQRLSPWRYIFFMLIVGIFSNTAQYLMSGPNFIGFSGILCGMLTFIWVRQLRAPWEGYQIDRLTLLFMLVFILGMAGIQFFSFILEQSLAIALSPNIANTAHIAGGLMGFILGQLNYFSWRQA
jgi:GlpG protein